MKEQLGADSAGAIYEEMAQAKPLSKIRGFCTRLKTEVSIDEICVGFDWRMGYTPILGCKNCRYWMPL